MSNISLRPADSGPFKSIIAIPLILVTTFCFSYILYNSAGNGAISTGSHAVLKASENTKPFADTSSLSTTQSELPRMSATVTRPDSSQKLTSKVASQVPDPTNTQTPQPSTRSNQTLQNTKANSSSDDTETNNPQHGSSKSQLIKLDLELPRL